MNNNFIAGAIKRPGALTAPAKKAGRSVAGEAQVDKSKPGLKGQQARFFNNVLKPANKKRKSGKPSGMTQALMEMQ